METNNNNTVGNNGDGKGGETPPNQNPQNPTTGNDTPSGNEQNGGAGEKKVLMGDINTKKIVEEKRKINILSSEDVQKRMSARTEQEIKNPPLGGEQSGSSAPLPTSLEEYRNKINEDSRKAVNEMTPDKYKSLAMSLVKVFDFLLSAGLRKYALDVTDSGYTIDQTKKDELAEQLSNILIVTNTMFPAVGVFIITLIAVYLTPIMNAYSHRQSALAIRDQRKKEGKPEVEIDPKTGLPKKKRGGQHKG